MTFDEIVEKRYSVRNYDPARPVPREYLLAMCEAARQAPTANNSQTGRYIVVTDPELRARLCAEGMGPVVKNRWMRDAPAVIVGCAKLDFLANKIGTAMTGVEYYAIDLGIAVEHMVLKATELGLGTCWVGWIHEENIRRILDIPANVRVLTMLAVGYAKDNTIPARKRKSLGSIVFSERWNHPIDPS